MRKLRIAFFTNSFPVSSEPFIALQAAELVALGHEVQIFGLSNLPPSPTASSPRVKSLLTNRYRNTQWPQNALPRIAKALQASLSTSIRTKTIRVPILRPLTFRRTWLDLSCAFQGEAVAGHAPFDILHCQFATLGEHVIKLKDAGLLSGQLVVHFRGYDITEVVQKFGPEVYHNLWDRSSRFVANCDHFRDTAISIGCPRDRIDVVGSGIDLTGFSYRPPLSLGSGPVRLVAVGRLARRKGFHTLIKAVARLTHSGMNVQLTLIGDGEERAALEHLSRALGIEVRVQFMGMQPHTEINRLLADSHMFAAPSETTSSGGADAPVNTIKEAMAVGVPVCATRHGGIPELVQEGVTGTLAREGDPEDLSNAITRLIDLESQWPEMTLSARRRVEDLYEISAVTRKLLEVYAKAMQKSPAII